MTRKLKNMVTAMIMFIVLTLEFIAIYLLITEGIESPGIGFLLLMIVLNLIFLISTTNYLDKVVTKEINLSINKAKRQELTTFVNYLADNTNILRTTVPLKDEDGKVIGTTTMYSEIAKHLEKYKKNNNLI